MSSFFSYLRQHKLPNRSTLRTLLTPPITWHGLVLYILGIATLVVLYSLVFKLNNTTMVSVPAHGGTLTEGVIGAPRFINPILATTETDLGLTKLVYSGLMKTNPDDDALVPDLAKEYQISPDGLTYTVTLREHLKWSDHKPLTSQDVAFTIERLARASTDPLQSSYWKGISVSTPSDTMVLITLPERRDDFLRALTIGLVPKHVWENISDQDMATAPQNLAPVGSGPLKLSHMGYENSVPHEAILVRNPYFAHPRLYIDEYHEVFFANQAELFRAIENGDIDMTLSATPATASLLTNTDLRIKKVASPYNVSLYHLRGESILANTKLVQILDQAIDKSSILATVVGGYGILPSTPTNTLASTPDDIIAEFIQLGYAYKDGYLSKNGAPVGFAIAVENDELALLTAQTLADELARFGMVVTVKAFDPGAFQDRLENGDFQVFLADESQPTPDVYEPVLTLYKKAYPFITTYDLRIPDPLTNPLDRYRYLQEWSVRNDRIWKFLYNIMNKK